MRTLLTTFWTVFVGALSVTGQETYYALDDYDKVEKIDSHFHIRTVDPTFVKLASQDRFKFLNVVVHTTNPTELKQKHQASFAQKEAHPGRVEVASAFPLEGWNEPGWIEKTIQYLDATFDQGAVAVKVWKDIGMEFRDKDGKRRQKSTGTRNKRQAIQIAQDWESTFRKKQTARQIPAGRFSGIRHNNGV